MRIIKSIVKTMLNKAGYEVYPKSINYSSNYSSNETMSAGLARLKLRNVNPSCIIDVGAAQGTWTAKAMECWPQSKYELVEPLYEQKVKLEEFKKVHSNINFHLAVAGEERGEVFLNITDDLDGSGIYGEQKGNIRQVPVIAIDDIAQPGGSYIIKLDTHGY